MDITPERMRIAAIEPRLETSLILMDGRESFFFLKNRCVFFEQMLLYFKKNYYLCPLNYVLVIFVEPQKF